jgi:hypothetical protein
VLCARVCFMCVSRFVCTGVLCISICLSVCAKYVCLNVSQDYGLSRAPAPPTPHLDPGPFSSGYRPGAVISTSSSGGGSSSSKGLDMRPIPAAEAQSRCTDAVTPTARTPDGPPRPELLAALATSNLPLSVAGPSPWPLPKVAQARREREDVGGWVYVCVRVCLVEAPTIPVAPRPAHPPFSGVNSHV